MATETLTLTEFLLARFAEEEANWRRDIWDEAVAQVALLDLAPKRRIVDKASDDMALYDEVFRDVQPTDCEDFTNGAAWALDFCLRALALPYAGHSDYRDEWRL